jgi:hypothetical protein
LWLEQRAQTGAFDTHDPQLFEDILTLDDRIREQCKIKIRKKFAEKVPFSDVIGKDRKEIRLWELIIPRISGKRIDTRKIRRLMKQTDQPTALRMTLQEAETAQAKCWTKYKTNNKNNAEELRKQFETRVNEKRAIKYKTSVETQEKITKHAFQSKNNFTRIRKVMDKKPRTALTSVEYTDEWAMDHECTTKEEIDKACMSEGYQRYAQTHDTPFLTTPLLRGKPQNLTPELQFRVLI